MSSKPTRSRRLLSTIGARLTLWWTAITLGTCALLCTLLYIGLAVSLSREVDGFLVGETQEFRTILEEEGSVAFDEIERDIRRELGSRLRKDLTFRLLDAHGRLVVTSDPYDALPTKVDSTTATSAANEPTFRTVEVAGREWPYRVCSQWVMLADHTVYQAQAAYRLDRRATSLAGFRRLCFAAMGLAAVLSVVFGLVLARRSLQPVRAMIEKARSIGGVNLSDRLPRSETGDELDDLAAVLNEMLSRLERQFEEIQRFTADAAHELRTPLTAMRGNMEVALQRDTGTEELRHVLEESIDQFDQLTRTANDLLLLARADAGHGFLHNEPMSLSDAVRDVVDLYAALALDRGVELTLVAGENIECVADGTRIRQVLSNLLDNALNYAATGGAVVVTVERRADAALVEVADNGPGIDAKHLPHLFDRFYRVDAARSRRTGGSGLGLAICRSIVEAHLGTITATSVVGRGTTISFTLPCHASGHERPADASQHKENSPR
ncbi:MAG TPA: heavy metal sensor histidine kinase [Phycisphaerae bacterium]|nr:heavy metal sensor histidine kinase [Phycisphaerae bacterium]